MVYTKPDIEEYGYFPIYIEKGIGDEFDVYPFTDNNVCKQIASVYAYSAIFDEKTKVIEGRQKVLEKAIVNLHDALKELEG